MTTRPMRASNLAWLRSRTDRKQSLGDALGTTAAYSCLSRLEDSVAGALAKSAGLVMMRCGNGPHPRLLPEGEGRNAAFFMLHWEQRSPRRCLGEDRRGEFGSLRESLAKTRGV